MKICIAPYAAKLPNDIPNPKTPPWWPELVARLVQDGHEVIQLGCAGEPEIAGVSDFLKSRPYGEIEYAINEADAWISVDSWLPHFCATLRLKSGIVIWSQSNPRIWGYKHNINLLKDHAFLRPYQYAHWFDVPYNPEAFVSPEVVIAALYDKLAVATA